MSTRRLCTALVLAALATLVVVAPAQAQDPVTFTGTVAGHSLAQAGANSPIVLRPDDATVVAVSVTNHGSSPVQVRSVRLDARVLGLAFFSYTTRVDLTVAPGATGTSTFVLDLGDLDGQATGLLPAGLSLIAPDRSVVAHENGTVDVKGKLASVYGVFGLAVAGITALLLLVLGIRLVRRSLPDNRWVRASRFAVPGVGLGLVVTFTLGVLRVAVPSRGLAFGMLLGGLLVGFVLGSLTPAPSDEADRDELDERDVLTPARTTLPVNQTVNPPVSPPVMTPAAPAVQAEPDDPRATRVVGPPAPPPPPPPTP